mmetsp:Transcript_28495/g.30656  ORF Transcript_28495/g.30656 Transcript_28495/m.30656 type:complete len:153 (+) Transcript_28495:351-809(+)
MTGGTGSGSSTCNGDTCPFGARTESVYFSITSTNNTLTYTGLRVHDSCSLRSHSYLFHQEEINSAYLYGTVTKDHTKENKQDDDDREEDNSTNICLLCFIPSGIDWEGYVVTNKTKITMTTKKKITITVARYNYHVQYLAAKNYTTSFGRDT